MAVKTNKGKGSYAEYKADNRVYKNKIKKLERHCKKYPNDEEGKKSLERIKKSGYTGRQKPLVPGSNPTTPKPKFTPTPGFLHYPQTAGEQLSELLGIPMVAKKVVKRKPKIQHKKQRNVQT